MRESQDKQCPEPRSDGFSLVEVLVVFVVVAILTTIALIGINRARDSFAFTNAVGTLQSHLERAVSDARRRNAKGAVRSRVRVISESAYEISIDFDGDGTPETRMIPLPQRTSFLFDPGAAPQATIDWRGQIAEGSVRFIVRSNSGQITEITISGRGDAAEGTTASLPTVSATPIVGDVLPSTVLIGNTVAGQPASPTPTPTPLPVCTGAQRPALSDCRCAAGKVIDSDGKCN